MSNPTRLYRSHPLLQCSVALLTYSYEHQTGEIEAQGVPDMSGAIKVFTDIDPAVLDIIVWNNSDPTEHTGYTRATVKSPWRVIRSVRRFPETPRCLKRD